MKSFNYFLLAIIVLCSSCSENDSVEDVSILGEWELTEWRIGLEADINKDGVASYNLLDEIECNNQELITVEEENIISIIVEENPKLYLTETNGANGYEYHIDCSEGIIGTASTYTLEGNMLEAFGASYLKDGNTLTQTIEYAIEIYNEDLTEAVGLLSSVKIYTKL